MSLYAIAAVVLMLRLATWGAARRGIRNAAFWDALVLPFAIGTAGAAGLYLLLSAYGSWVSLSKDDIGKAQATADAVFDFAANLATPAILALIVLLAVLGLFALSPAATRLGRKTTTEFATWSERATERLENGLWGWTLIVLVLATLTSVTPFGGGHSHVTGILDARLIWFETAATRHLRLIHLRAAQDVAEDALALTFGERSQDAGGTGGSDGFSRPKTPSTPISWSRTVSNLVTLSGRETKTTIKELERIKPFVESKLRDYIACQRRGRMPTLHCSDITRQPPPDPAVIKRDIRRYQTYRETGKRSLSVARVPAPQSTLLTDAAFPPDMTSGAIKRDLRQMAQDIQQQDRAQRQHVRGKLRQTIFRTLTAYGLGEASSALWRSPNPLVRQFADAFASEIGTKGIANLKDFAHRTQQQSIAGTPPEAARPSPPYNPAPLQAPVTRLSEQAHAVKHPQSVIHLCVWINGRASPLNHPQCRRW